MMATILEDDALSRVRQAIVKAIDRLHELDPNDKHYFTKSDLENALGELNDAQFIRT